LSEEAGRSGSRFFPLLTDHQFPKPLDFNLEKYLGGSFTVMKGNGDPEVVIEFGS
jgi:hypothetical protein